MRNARPGRVGASGLRWTGAAQVGYASSKAAVIQFGRVTAVE
jgi:hypothetical protein